MSAKTPIWELQNITKSFPGVRANDDVSLKLNAGEIHGLLGENGCGKSTLIKILSGVYRPDSGTLLRNGAEVTPGSPVEARTMGVATVFQEFSLAPTLSVAENIFLGRYKKRGLFLDWTGMRREAARVLTSLEIEIAPEKLVGELSVAEQQLVEIAKAISMDATLMILDEPTTALGEGEIATLHRLLRRMKARGVAVLYISHRLDEVVNLVDAATILKDGKVVSEAEGTQLDVRDIVSRMVGQSIEEHFPKQDNRRDEVLMEVRGLSSVAGVNDVNLDLHRGEVLGLGGVIGSGRTEIARALFGADKATGGEVSLNGFRFRPKTPRQAIAAGLGLVPENRKFDGLFFNFNGGPNMTSAALDRICGRFLRSTSREADVARDLIDDLEISPLAAEKFVSLLSGGNQQKIVIARWLFAQSQVLILDEPTQGIDIGAKVAVYRLINDLTAKGCGVILISSDHNELIAMSDRIGVVRGGRIVETLPAAQVTHSHLVQASAEAGSNLAA